MKTVKHRASALPQKVRQAIGLDLGDKYSYWCHIDRDGEVLANGRFRTNADQLTRIFAKLPKTLVAIEAGTHSAWVERELKTLGHEVLVANPRKLRAIHTNDRKNDRADAEILARTARLDRKLLAPIRHRNAEMQADLAIIRARDMLVRSRTQAINTARGLVKASGGRLPSCEAYAFAQKVANHIPAELAAAVTPLLELIAHMTKQIRSYDDRIERLAHEKYPHTHLMDPIHGVAALTSTTYVLTLADPTRFKQSRSVGPYLGVVPRLDDSGDRRSQLRITKAGNSLLRRLLVQSAHQILRRNAPDSDLRRFGLRIAERGGKNAKKRAVIAVARKLAVLMHRLWITGEVYQPLRSTNLNQAA